MHFTLPTCEIIPFNYNISQMQHTHLKHALNIANTEKWTSPVQLMYISIYTNNSNRSIHAELYFHYKSLERHQCGSPSINCEVVLQIEWCGRINPANTQQSRTKPSHSTRN